MGIQRVLRSPTGVQCHLHSENVLTVYNFRQMLHNLFSVSRRRPSVEFNSQASYRFINSNASRLGTFGVIGVSCCNGYKQHWQHCDVFVITKRGKSAARTCPNTQYHHVVKSTMLPSYFISCCVVEIGVGTPSHSRTRGRPLRATVLSRVEPKMPCCVR